MAVNTPKYMPPSTVAGSVSAQNERRRAASTSRAVARGSVFTGLRANFPAVMQ